MKLISDLLVNIDALVPIDEKILVSYLIKGLSSNFEIIATIICQCLLLPIFLQARSMFPLEEQCPTTQISFPPTVLDTPPSSNSNQTRLPNGNNCLSNSRSNNNRMGNR